MDNKFNEIGSSVKDTLTDKAKDVANKVEKSSEDWFSYIQKHPLQTIILGLACIGLGALFNRMGPQHK